MRGALLVPILILALMPTAASTDSIRLQVTVTLNPTSMNVTAAANQNQSLKFYGNITVSMLPNEQANVQITYMLFEAEHDLTSSGWNVSISPSTMSISDGVPHSFTSIVTVPANCPNTSADFLVSGFVQAYPHRPVTSDATALITVTGASSINQTAHNQTGTNQSVNPPSQPGKPIVAGLSNSNLLMISGAALVMSVAGVVTFATIKKRKTMRLIPRSIRD